MILQKSIQYADLVLKKHVLLISMFNSDTFLDSLKFQKNRIYFEIEIFCNRVKVVTFDAF